MRIAKNNSEEPNPKLALKIVSICLPIATLIGFITGLIVNEGSIGQALTSPIFLWSFVYWPLIPIFWAQAKNQERE